MQIAANKQPLEDTPIIDAAPVEGLIRKPEVLRLLQCNSVTIWRMCRDGRFPKPVHITSRAIGWRRVDVLRWLAELK